MTLIFWIIVTATGFFILDRLGLWMESRGWIYYRRSKGGGGSVGNAFLELQSMLEPDKKHVLEIKQKEREKEADSGDPPESGDNTNV